MLKVGTKAPEFNLPDQDGKMHSLAGHRGKWILIYFYPKDMTPGCTTEACSMRDMNKEFAKRHAIVFGVSKDSVKSHVKFADKHALNFPILSDETGEMITAYESIGKKKFMGREFVGIYRNSYLIDPDGLIARAYEGVKPAEHAEEVIRSIDILSK